LFYLYHLKKLVRSETFGPTVVCYCLMGSNSVVVTGLICGTGARYIFYIASCLTSHGSMFGL